MKKTMLKLGIYIFVICMAVLAVFLIHRKDIGKIDNAATHLQNIDISQVEKMELQPKQYSTLVSRELTYDECMQIIEYIHQIEFPKEVTITGEHVSRRSMGVNITFADGTVVYFGGGYGNIHVDNHAFRADSDMSETIYSFLYELWNNRK